MAWLHSGAAGARQGETASPSLVSDGCFWALDGSKGKVRKMVMVAGLTGVTAPTSPQ